MFFSKKPLHKGKVLQTERLIMQPLTVDLNGKHESIVADLVNIFSNPLVFNSNPNRRLENEEQASNFVYSTLIDYEKERGFNYFIFRKDTRRLIGTIYLLPPKSVIKFYPAVASWPSVKKRIDKAWMIEFYLDANYWRMGIMSLFVRSIVEELFEQGAETVTALVSESNKASLAILGKLDFRVDSHYKDLQGQILCIKYRNPFHYEDKHGLKLL